jgi:DNA uptake protein ComE-like DNA-binding protein
MDKLFYFLKKHLEFSRSESRVFLLMTALLALVAAGSSCVFHFYRPSQHIDITAVSVQAHSLSGKNTKTVQRDTGNAKQWAYFDPNTVSRETLRRFPLSQRIRRNLLAYREAGAVFKKVEDLKNIYGINHKVWKELKPYVRFTSEEKPKVIQESRGVKMKREPIVIDVNRAKEKEWQQLHGIGSFYAAEMVKYRKALGGFYAINQVFEMPTSHELAIDTTGVAFTLDKSLLERNIQVNTMEFQELVKHPYLSQKQASQICNFRKVIKRYASWKDLMKVYSLKAEDSARIFYYVSFDD